MADPSLTPDQVRKVARLSRLAIPEDQIEMHRARLSAVLGYMERLRELDLGDVAPMANVGETTNRFDADEVGPTIPNAVFMAMAPGRMEPFITVPKVLEDGGGA